jgi:prepilin peptidase CpaA
LRPELLRLLPAAYVLLLLTAAITDLRQRRIPNWTVASLLVLFGPCAWLGLTPGNWTSGLAAFGLALAGSGLLYLLGWLGAGDSKLFSAVALFAGLGNLGLLAAATAIAGGLYAFGVLFIRPKQVLRGMTAAGRADGVRRGIPYGVAITAGALTTACLTHFVEPDRLLALFGAGATAVSVASR